MKTKDKVITFIIALIAARNRYKLSLQTLFYNGDYRPTADETFFTIIIIKLMKSFR